MAGEWFPRRGADVPGCEGFALYDTWTEARLIAAIYADDGTLEECNELEVDDFFDLHFRSFFSALRNLQATGKPYGIGECFDWLRSHGYTQPDVTVVGAAVLKSSKFPTLESLRRAIEWLQRLSRRRANEQLVPRRRGA